MKSKMNIRQCEKKNNKQMSDGLKESALVKLPEV